MEKWIIVYLLIMNLCGFAAMGLDKHKAKKKAWRLSEKLLFGISVLGGSVGTWMGMYVFHHKTRHWYFVVGMPLILVLQAMLAIYIIYIKMA